MKRNFKKIFFDVIFITKNFIHKILLNEVANDQDFAKLTWGLDNVE